MTIDLFAGAATQQAKYILPASAFAEKEGTFVNQAGLAQPLKRCVKPPRECRTEAQVFSDLLGRRGLVSIADVRHEMAAEIAFFAPLANGIAAGGLMLAGS
jgi:predicted molibdopterin-dependent oxidoreductase YjgC